MKAERVNGQLIEEFNVVLGEAKDRHGNQVWVVGLSIEQIQGLAEGDTLVVQIGEGLTLMVVGGTKEQIYERAEDARMTMAARQTACDLK